MTKHRLFWPLLVLVALLASNLFFTAVVLLGDDEGRATSTAA